MKFLVKNCFSKCDQIRRKLRIWSHLLKNLWWKTSIFCAVVPPLMLYLKVGFIIFWCRTFGNLEWGLLLQFTKCCKNLKMSPHSCLIPTTPKMPTTFWKCRFTMNTNSLKKKVYWVELRVKKPTLDVRKTKSVDATEQKMICISNTDLKEFSQKFRRHSNIFKIG